MKIAVCDDDPETLDWFAATLNGYFSGRPSGRSLRLFSNAGTMVDQIRDGYRPDLIFLAAEERNLSAAKTARSLAGDFILVLMAANGEHALDGYQVHAYSYLIKPIPARSVTDILEAANADPCREIELKINGSVAHLTCSELAYLESDKHHVLFHTRNRTVKVFGKLDTFEDMLKNNGAFIRCHKSFLVNMNHIGEAKGSRFYLLDGTVIPIRRKDAAKYKAMYFSHTANKN